MVKIYRNRNSRKGRISGRSRSCRGEQMSTTAHRIKKRTQSYGKYIRKLLRDVHPSSTISKKAVSVVNSFMNYVFQIIAVESGNLVHYKNQQTICSAEIKTAVMLILPHELAQHAICSANKAAKKFRNSKLRDAEKSKDCRR